MSHCAFFGVIVIVVLLLSGSIILLQCRGELHASPPVRVCSEWFARITENLEVVHTRFPRLAVVFGRRRVHGLCERASEAEESK